MVFLLILLCSSRGVRPPCRPWHRSHRLPSSPAVLLLLLLFFCFLFSSCCCGCCCYGCCSSSRWSTRMENCGHSSLIFRVCILVSSVCPITFIPELIPSPITCQIVCTSTLNSLNKLKRGQTPFLDGLLSPPCSFRLYQTQAHLMQRWNT